MDGSNDVLLIGEFLKEEDFLFAACDVKDLLAFGFRDELKGAVGLFVGNEIVMKPQGNVDAKFLILLPRSELNKMNTPIDIGIYNSNKLIKKVSTSFLAPIKRNQ